LFYFAFEGVFKPDFLLDLDFLSIVLLSDEFFIAFKTDFFGDFYVFLETFGILFKN